MTNNTGYHKIIRLNIKFTMAQNGPHLREESRFHFGEPEVSSTQLNQRGILNTKQVEYPES